MTEEKTILYYQEMMAKNQEQLVSIIREFTGVVNKTDQEAAEEAKARIKAERRDIIRYFAAAALPSCYSGYAEYAKTHGWDENWQKGVAMDAFRIANEMIDIEESQSPIEG